MDGNAFRVTLEPDARDSHWFKVDQAPCEAAGVGTGDRVALEIVPVTREAPPPGPVDLQAALGANKAAKTTRNDITALARRDWIHWITSGKKLETRIKRIGAACDKLASGRGRAGCFDRSGGYSKDNMGAPEPGAAVPPSLRPALHAGRCPA